MTTIDPNGYACATCRAPLNVHTVDGNTHFDHPQPPTDNHPPRPTPIQQVADLQMICDFCSTPNPQWSYHFGKIDILVTMPTGTVISGHDFGERWAACTPCANLIDAGNQPALTHRARSKGRRRGLPTEASAHLEHLHRALFANGIPHRQPLHTPGTLQTPTPVTSDAAPQVREIRPTIMPKVRDRLAHYWRHHAARHFSSALSPEQLHALADQLTFDSDTPTPTAEAQPPIERYTALLTHHADHAALYWIDPEFTQLARHAAASLPTIQVAPHEPPTTEGLLIWSVPICHAHIRGTARTIPIIAAQWGRTPGGLWVTFFTHAELATTPIHTNTDLQRLRERMGWLAPVSTGAALTFNQPYTPATADTTTMITTLISTWILAAQPDSQTDHIEADKTIRRAYARTQREAPRIRIIKLRPKNPSTATSPNNDHDAARTFRHRWWVNGFWRQQPYGPGRTLRRRTYVRGHMKGPDGAPLLLTTTVHVLGNPNATPDPNDPPQPDN